MYDQEGYPELNILQAMTDLSWNHTSRASPALLHVSLGDHKGIYLLVRMTLRRFFRFHTDQWAFLLHPSATKPEEVTPHWKHIVSTVLRFGEIGNEVVGDHMFEYHKPTAEQ